jgi:hypothetical protein
MVAALLACLLGMATVPPGAPAGVVIEPAVVDFGRLASGESRTGRFVVRNTGTAPVKVNSAFPSCKCTAVTDLAGREIPPGGSVELSATMEAPRAPGEKDAKIFVLLDGAAQPMVAKMKGVVTWPVQPDPPFVDALQGRRKGTIRLASTDGKPFRVLSVDGRPAGGTSEEGSRAEHEIAWDLTTLPEGGLRQWMLVETDHPDAILIPLRVRHESTGVRFDPDADKRGWFLPESAVLCGRVKPGQAVERTLVLENGTPRGKPKPAGWDQVQGVKSLDPRVKAELLKSEPRGDSVVLTLRFTFEAPASGLVYLPVAIRSALGEGRCFATAVVDP